MGKPHAIIVTGAVAGFDLATGDSLVQINHTAVSINYNWQVLALATKKFGLCFVSILPRLELARHRLDATRSGRDWKPSSNRYPVFPVDGD